MPARGRKPTAAMPQQWQPAPAEDRPLFATVDAPPGWLCGSRKTAWKSFEECTIDDPWAEEAPAGGFRRRVVKVECQHKRKETKQAARAIVRGEEQHLERVYANALIVPCQYTECPRWIDRRSNEVR